MAKQMMYRYSHKTAALLANSHKFLELQRFGKQELTLNVQPHVFTNCYADARCTLKKNDSQTPLTGWSIKGCITVAQF